MLTTLLLPVFIAALANDSYREIRIKVEPPQPLKAISLRSGDDVVPVEIRDGKAIVPATLPLPWVVNVVRFEPAVFTQADLDQGRSLLVRQLGVIHGVIRGLKANDAEKLTFLLWRGRPNGVDEVNFGVNDAGAFDLPIPAGVYQGVVLGEQHATRIRSAILVQPGQVTDIGSLITQPTTRVSLRVVDGKTHAPVAGALVGWKAPGGLNAEAAAVLYARRWSTTTNARGLAVLNSVGPAPIPLQWRVSTRGYATELTRSAELRDAIPLALPDMQLRPQVAIIARIQIPSRASSELHRAKIVLGDADEENSLRFKPVSEAPLRQGQTRFISATYGRKRIWLENEFGKKILYRDFDINAETTTLDLLLSPVDIYGRVLRGASPIEGAIVRVADPHDARVVLAIAKSDAGGAYRLTTFQSGRISIYAVPLNATGASSYPVSRDVDLNGSLEYQVDFEVPDSGAVINVLDASTGEPLAASIDQRLTFANGRSQMGLTKTDAAGRLVLSGFPEGTAHLYIHCPDHFAKEVDLSLTDQRTETVVRLEKSRSISGRVVDISGAPVGGASIVGGYRDELAQQAAFETISDGNGRFRFDYEPVPGTIFYVIANGNALGIATLRQGVENVITVFPPARTAVFLLSGDAPPTKPYFVIPAPEGENYIPLGVLQDLAMVNGLSLYQLAGTTRDGSVALAEFLSPGKYDFFVIESGGKPPWTYQRIGKVVLPSAGNIVLTFSAGR